MTTPGSQGKGLDIVGIGAISALGYSAAEIVAGVRASLSRFSAVEMASDFLESEDPESDPDEPPIASAGIVPDLTEDMAWWERCFHLGAHALRGAARQAGLTAQSRERIALLVARPSGAADSAADGLTGMLAALLPSSLKVVRFVEGGHTGALAGLQEAMELLEQSQVDVCLIGGCDSRIDFDALYDLDQARRLKHSANMEGFVPGEAAAFLAVRRNSEKSGPGLVRVAQVGLAQEEVTAEVEAPCLAVGLSRAVKEVTGGPFSTDRIDLLVNDLNGEPYRSEEWAAMLTRCVAVSPKEFTLWHPADGLGDVASASSALHLALAVQGLVCGATKRREALVLSSSETMLRGAALLTRTGD